MKLISLVIASAVLFLSFQLHAELKKSDLEKGATLTQEATLLQQVDTISLYLTSERVVFAPRLTKEGIVEVESTILAPELISNKEDMERYMARLIDTFIRLLKERLPTFAPAIAKGFDSNKDIVFVVNAGAKRKPVGTWKGGGWAGRPTPPEPSESPPPEEGAKKGSYKKGCGCPAAVD